MAGIAPDNGGATSPSHRVVAQDDGWVALYTGEPVIASLVRTQLDRHAIASRFDKALGARGGRDTIVTVLVHDQTLSAARLVIAGLGSQASAEPSHVRTADGTRLLCATAVLSRLRRASWLAMWRRKSAAVAPELGVDVKLLAQICTFMDRRDHRYEWILGILIPLAMFGIGIAAQNLAVLSLLIFSYYPMVAITLLTKWYHERWTLTSVFARAHWDPSAAEQQFRTDLPRDIAAKTADPDHNLVVYSNYTPFVGSGGRLDGWTFVVDTTKPAEDIGAVKTPRPFTASEIHTAVLGRIRELHVPNSEIRDCLFVSGRDIRNDREILPDVYGHPVQRVSPARIERLRADNSGSLARWYPWIRIYDANSEVILSVFLRFHLQGKHLFVEMARHVLSPLASHCREIDHIGPPSLGSLLILAAKAIAASPFASYYFFFRLLKRGLTTLKGELGLEEYQHRRTVHDSPRYNYGVALSLREEMSSGTYLHYFEQVDTQMYVKMLDVTILDSVVDFLREHDIDTSSLKEQSAMVLNQGIIVQRGDVKAGSLAVGQGAKATSLQDVGTLVGRLRKPKQEKGATA